MFVKSFDPVQQGVPAVDPESGGRDAICALAIRPNLGPIEECHIGARAADLVGVKEMVGADIILVD